MHKHNHKHQCPIGSKCHSFTFLKVTEQGDWYECTKCGIWVKEHDLNKYEHD